MNFYLPHIKTIFLNITIELIIAYELILRIYKRQLFLSFDFIHFHNETTGQLKIAIGF